MPSDDFEFNISRSAIEKLAHNNELKKGLTILGQEAERSAKSLAPVDTGNLRRSITYDVGRDFKGWFMRYGTNVEYGIYQELGTRFHPPHPYLRPTLEVLKRFIRGNN